MSGTHDFHRRPSAGGFSRSPFRRRPRVRKPSAPAGPSGPPPPREEPEAGADDDELNPHDLGGGD